MAPTTSIPLLLKQEKLSDFPSEKIPTKYGFGLFATRDLKTDTLVQIFTQHGNNFKESEYETEIPDSEKAHCLLHNNTVDKTWVWIITQSDARFANHSCEPNCILDEFQQLKTFKKVLKGQELSFLYNSGLETDYWDQRFWSFQCGCGSSKCQGMIDRYRPFDRYGNRIN